jgi:hypothetical protein
MFGISFTFFILVNKIILYVKPQSSQRIGSFQCQLSLSPHHLFHHFWTYLEIPLVIGHIHTAKDVGTEIRGFFGRRRMVGHLKLSSFPNHEGPFLDLWFHLAHRFEARGAKLIFEPD